MRLSLDGGATFPILLGAATGETTSLSFPVPNTPTTHARVKLTAWDTLGNPVSDVSDADFQIISLAQVNTTLSTVTASPTTVVGGGTVRVTVTLSAAAPSGGASVPLASTSPTIAPVPASVVVPAGSTAASVSVATKTVSASTAVTVAAAYGGVTRTTSFTVTPSSTTAPPPATDSVSVTRAEYATSKRELRVEATGSSSSATSKVYVAATGELVGTLPNLGGGKYGGQLTWATNPQRITVRSSGGGSATASVVAK